MAAYQYQTPNAFQAYPTNYYDYQNRYYPPIQPVQNVPMQQQQVQQTQQPQTQPVNQQSVTPSVVQRNIGTGINWVQGEAGAKSYYVPSGQTMMLMDSESDVFYIKMVDANGVPLPLRIFDYKERKNTVAQPQNSNIDMSMFITREEFNQRINDLIQSSQPVKEATTQQKKEAKSKAVRTTRRKVDEPTV